MWTPTVTSVTKQGRNIIAAVNFEQSGETRTEAARGDDLTADNLAQWCKNVIASYEAGDAAFVELKALEGQVVDIPADTGAAAAVFFKLRVQATALQKAIDAGLSKNQAGLDVMNTQLKTAFLPEYLEDSRWG